MPAFGVNVDDALLDEIEKPLAYGDKRSERIRNLLEIALAAERAGKRRAAWPDDHDDRVDMVEAAIELYIEEWDNQE